MSLQYETEKRAPHKPAVTAAFVVAAAETAVVTSKPTLVLYITTVATQNRWLPYVPVAGTPPKKRTIKPTPPV